MFFVICKTLNSRLNDIKVEVRAFFVTVLSVIDGRTPT